MENKTATKKFAADFTVVENIRFSPLYSLLKVSPKGIARLSDANIRPGQFVQIATPRNATYLRRPISVCNVDIDENLLWLLVRRAGKGTAAICDMTAGEVLNIIYPLGNGFSTENDASAPLLIGGGVGVAPLLYLGRFLAAKGMKPRFLLGARSASDLLLLDEFRKYGETFISTEDGSAGEKGLVTTNSVLDEISDAIFCCGPMPMMKAVASIAKTKGITCEVSLENVMACGVGACLCCVEKTVRGNLCVCQDGPVFDIDMLTW